MYLTLKDLVNNLTLSKSTIYRLIKSGHFPAPVKISCRRVAWRKCDLDDWKSKSDNDQKIYSMRLKLGNDS